MGAGGCSCARGRVTVGYRPSNVTSSCPWTPSAHDRTQSHAPLPCSHPKCALGIEVRGCGCGWVGAGEHFHAGSCDGGVSTLKRHALTPLIQRLGEVRKEGTISNRYCSNKHTHDLRWAGDSVLHQPPWNFGTLNLPCPRAGRLVHTGLSSSSLVANVLHYPPPPRKKIYNRYCRNK